MRLKIDLEIPEWTKWLGTHKLLSCLGIFLALITLAVTVAFAYDTSWSTSGQVLSAAKLKTALDEAQSRIAALETAQSSGSYTVPSKCRAYLSTDPNGIPHGRSYYKIPYDATTFDTNSEFSILDHVWVAKSSGYYQVNALVTLSGYEVQKEYQAVLFRDSTVVSAPDIVSSSVTIPSAYLYFAIADLVYVAKGSSLSVSVYSGSSGDTTSLVGVGAYNYISIYKVSD
jgi:hypothetical protein